MPSYPPYPLAGIPTALTISPESLTLALGQTAQLSPILLDANGNTVTPSQAFTYRTSNPLVSVSDTGLCTAAPATPGELQTGGIATIRISYPWAGADLGQRIETSVLIAVTVPPGISNAIFITEDTAGSGTPTSGGWTHTAKVYPSV